MMMMMMMQIIPNNKKKTELINHVLLYVSVEKESKKEVISIECILWYKHRRGRKGRKKKLCYEC